MSIGALSCFTVPGSWGTAPGQARFLTGWHNPRTPVLSLPRPRSPLHHTKRLCFIVPTASFRFKFFCTRNVSSVFPLTLYYLKGFFLEFWCHWFCHPFSLIKGQKSVNCEHLHLLQYNPKNSKNIGVFFISEKVFKTEIFHSIGTSCATDQVSPLMSCMAKGTFILCISVNAAISL